MCYKTKSDSCLRKSIKIRTYEKPVKTSSAVAAVKQRFKVLQFYVIDLS